MEDKIKKAKSEIKEKLDSINKQIANSYLDYQLKETLNSKLFYFEKQINHELFDEDIEQFYEENLNKKESIEN